MSSPRWASGRAAGARRRVRAGASCPRAGPAGIVVHGIDISADVHRARPPRCADGCDVRAPRARAPAVRRRVRRRDLPVPGRVRADDGRRRGRRRRRRDGPGAAPGGRLRSSAFNAYFAVRYHEAATFDAATGVAHERTEVRDPDGGRRGRPVDRLLHAPRAAPALGRTASRSSGSAASSPAPMATTRRPPSPPSSSSSPAATKSPTHAAHRSVGEGRDFPRGLPKPGRPPTLGSGLRPPQSAAEAEGVAGGVGEDAEGRAGCRGGGRRGSTARRWAASMLRSTSRSRWSCCWDVGSRPRRGDEVGRALEGDRPGLRRARARCHPVGVLGRGSGATRGAGRRTPAEGDRIGAVERNGVEARDGGIGHRDPPSM